MTRAEEQTDDDWRAALERAPDPERARKLAEAALEALPGDRADRLQAERAPALAALLLALCGIAPFFAPWLRRHPEWIESLTGEDLTRPLARDALQARLERALDAGGTDEESALRRFKYYELARITLRDCRTPLARSGETLVELSQLADALLERALEAALHRVEERFGPARWRVRGPEGEREVGLSFCVIALGKLGGSELNFSSDVDLVYVYEAPAGDLADEPGRVSPGEYFTRLCQRFGTLVSARSPEGFLYRVDLDLRPSGAQGPPVTSDDAFSSYYELWADTWEKATFTKARPVAGDRAFGWRTIRAVDPMIYRSAMDYAAVRSIRELKDKFETAHGAGGDGFDVKLDLGGIREVEFVAQAMQLLHGARIPQLRTRSTRDTLDQLARVGLVEREQTHALTRDYLYLRRLENRLQMEEERQVHVLPADPVARTRIARAMGHTGPEPATALDAELEACRQRVHASYESVLVGSGADGGAEVVLDIFVRGAPQLFSFPASRRMLEDLAESFAREIDASSDPERALNNLDRFVKAIGGRRFYYELLLDRPELVPRLAGCFGSSKFLSDYVARHPRLIEPLFHDPELLLLDRRALRKQLIALTTPRDDQRDPVDIRLDGLRLFHHAQTVNVGLLDLAGLVEPAEVQAALSDIAELCLEDALAFSREQLASRVPAPGASAYGYAVIAMGKLATRELTYGSDLDVVFLFDAKRPDGEVDLAAQEAFVRLSQRVISTLQTATTEGSCYEIDARLRPSGNQGTLVTSFDAFRRYHESSAEVWERQALLRARPAAGDEALGAAFAALRLEILAREAPPDTLAEIHRVRQRMEVELARETSAQRNFKTGRGGVLDVECIVQALQLLHGHAHPALFDVAPTAVQLDRLAQLGLLSADTAGVCTRA